MANHPSAERRNRQRIKRTARNRSVKSAMRTEVRKARTAIGEDKADAAALVMAVVSKVDRAASKGIIHPRAASRTKSRLARQLHAASKTESK